MNHLTSIDPATLPCPGALPDQLLEDCQEGLDAALEAEGAFLADPTYEAQIEPLLDRVPPKEADAVYMYYLRRKRQAEIAAVFGVSQAAISYRLVRGLQRLKFLLSIPQVTEEEMRRDLAPVFPITAADRNRAQAAKSAPVPLDVEILVGIWHTTCQSEVATNLNLTQGRVRHRFFKALARLQTRADTDPVYAKYAQLFLAISENFNILREVKLPQWASRGIDTCT